MRTLNVDLEFLFDNIQSYLRPKETSVLFAKDRQVLLNEVLRLIIAIKPYVFGGYSAPFVIEGYDTSLIIRRDLTMLLCILYETRDCLRLNLNAKEERKSIE